MGVEVEVDVEGGRLDAAGWLGGCDDGEEGTGREVSTGRGALKRQEGGWMVGGGGASKWRRRRMVMMVGGDNVSGYLRAVVGGCT